MTKQISVWGYVTELADGRFDWWVTCDKLRAAAYNRILDDRGEGPLMRLLLVADDPRSETAMAEFVAEKLKRAGGNGK